MSQRIRLFLIFLQANQKSVSKIQKLCMNISQMLVALHSVPEGGRICVIVCILFGFLFRLSIRKWRNICARGGFFFFLQTNFDFLTSHFWRNFFISFKRYCCPELKFEKIFHLWLFFVKLWGFKDCHFAHFDQFGTINARYNSRY